MLCESCKERDAIVQHIQVTPTGVKHVHLCDKCAAEKGVEITITMQQHPLGDLVQAVQQASAATADASSCSFCGSTQRDFRMTGRLGCAHCYEALEHSLRALLRQLHGNSKHVGVRYTAPQVQMESSVDSIHDLEDRLRRAVASEQFELGRRVARPYPGAGMTVPKSSLDLSLLPDGGVRWLDASGTNADIVISTRMRLARNVTGYAFTARAREAERLRMLAQVRDALSGVPTLQGSVLLRLDELSPVERQLLHERHLVSKELAGLDTQHPLRTGAAVFLGEDAGLLVNEEDHLRLQALRSGFAVPAAFEAVQRLDRELGARVPYAFHREFGFLTACPTNVGTGLRASVLIHLPGLVLTKEIKKVLTGLQQMGLTYRGLYGEGSEVVGNFFQLSNQTTLGRSEEELQDLLVRVVRHVIEREEEARRVLVREAGYIIEDKLWRAYGTLRYARSLTFDEAMNFLSGVRLAVGLKLISGLSVYTLNKLLIFAQSAHLQHQEGKVLTDSEANLVRARYVRQALVSEGGGHA